MTKMGSVSAAACMAAFLLAGCANESLGPEYRELSEEESGLQFYAPGLAGGYRKIISGQDEQFVNRTVAIYGPRQGEFPHGQLLLIEMPPDRHFTRIDPPAEMIGDWGTFENRQIVSGPTGTAFNAIGRADYFAFQADGVACVAFREPFGTVHDTGRGTRLLDGYYCKGPAPMMTVGEAEAVIRSAGHAEYGVAARPADWPEQKEVAAAPKPDAAHSLPPNAEEDENRGGKASGTGFFVNGDGVLVTNAHVVDGCQDLAVRNLGGAEVIAVDKSADLAALRLTEPRGVAFAVFRTSESLRLGDDVIVFGFPLAGDLASSGNLTTGSVSSLAGIDDDTRLYQITAPIQPGNSGGPIFDRSGLVAGVVVAALSDLYTLSRTGRLPQNVNFGIKGSLVRNFLDAHRIDYSVSSNENRMETPDIAAKAQDVSAHIICSLPD